VSFVAEYRSTGFKTQRLRTEEGGSSASTAEVDISFGMGVARFWDVHFQDIGKSSSREEHCANMIDCSCAVIIEAVEG
jgi:hypothetical protein